MHVCVRLIMSVLFDRRLHNLVHKKRVISKEVCVCVCACACVCVCVHVRTCVSKSNPSSKWCPGVNGVMYHMY